jgi:hypothetical protein
MNSNILVLMQAIFLGSKFSFILIISKIVRYTDKTIWLLEFLMRRSIKDKIFLALLLEIYIIFERNKR